LREPRFYLADAVVSGRVRIDVYIHVHVDNEDKFVAYFVVFFCILYFCYNMLTILLFLLHIAELFYAPKYYAEPEEEPPLPAPPARGPRRLGPHVTYENFFPVLLIFSKYL